MMNLLTKTHKIIGKIRNKLVWGLVTFDRKFAQKGIFITRNYKHIKELNNKYQGQRCFVVGNGPSLKVSDLDKLKNEYSFAANRIYLAFEETAWRPNFYFIDDSLVLKRDHLILKEKDLGNSECFYPQQSKIWVKHPPQGTYYDLIFKDYYPELSEFSNDIVEKVYWGATVVYSMLQFAFYMGFNEIYLIGMDFHFTEPKAENNNGSIITSGGQQNHFHKDYRNKGEEYHTPRLHLQEKSFEAARLTGERNGIKIYNATRGGKLEVFERYDFDSIEFHNGQPEIE